jgi:hypothetical protein
MAMTNALLVQMENEILAALETPGEQEFDPNRHSIFQDKDNALENAQQDQEAALQYSLQG